MLLPIFSSPNSSYVFFQNRKSLQSLLDTRFFSRVRRLSLEITLALMLNMVRPGERVGYQKVIDRFFSETGLAFSHQKVVKPPDIRTGGHLHGILLVSHGLLRGLEFQGGLRQGLIKLWVVGLQAPVRVPGTAALQRNVPGGSR